MLGALPAKQRISSDLNGTATFHRNGGHFGNLAKRRSANSADIPNQKWKANANGSSTTRRRAATNSISTAIEINPSSAKCHPRRRVPAHVEGVISPTSGRQHVE
jgi:hypothetical protein